MSGDSKFIPCFGLAFDSMELAEGYHLCTHSYIPSTSACTWSSWTSLTLKTMWGSTYLFLAHHVKPVQAVSLAASKMKGKSQTCYLIWYLCLSLQSHTTPKLPVRASGSLDAHHFAAWCASTSTLVPLLSAGELEFAVIKWVRYCGVHQEIGLKKLRLDKVLEDTKYP